MLVTSFSPRVSVTGAAWETGGLQGPRTSLNALGCEREHQGPANEEKVLMDTEGYHHFLWVVRFTRGQLILLRML